MPQVKIIATGELRDVTDVQYAEIQNSAGAARFEFLGGTTPVPGAVTGAPTVSTNQSQVDQLLSGLSTPMTVEQIRAREREQKSEILGIASSTFDPLIRAAQKTGEQQLGSASAQLGIKRGLGFSSAETSFLNSVQNEIGVKIKDIEAKKAEFISTGNFNAVKQADDTLLKMNEMQNNIILQKGTMALQLFGIEQNAYQFEKTFAQSIDSDMFNRKLQTAGLTGFFDGAETLQAKQGRIQNALAEASLTGTYAGNPTLAKQQYLEDIKNQSFTNQIALFSMLSSIPQSQSVTIQMPDGTSKTYKGLQRPIGTGKTKDESKDIYQLAVEDIRAAEAGQYSSSENWWQTVDTIVAAYADIQVTVSRDDANIALMQRLRADSGQTLELNEEIDKIATQNNLVYKPTYQEQGLGAFGTGGFFGQAWSEETKKFMEKTPGAWLEKWLWGG